MTATTNKSIVCISEVEKSLKTIENRILEVEGHISIKRQELTKLYQTRGEIKAIMKIYGDKQ